MINRRIQGLGLLRTAGLIVAGLSIVATPVITGIFNSARLLAQPAATPRFQSVSVRSCQDLPNTRRGSGYSNSGGVLRTGCVQLADERGLGLIERASGRRWPALLPVKGQPEWFASDLYEITGVASADTSPATMEGPMLRAALEDRFRLQMHEESAEVAVYELHVEPAGPKFSRFMEGSCTSQPLSFPVPQLPAGQRYCKALVAVRPPAIDADRATLQEFRGCFRACWSGQSWTRPDFQANSRSTSSSPLMRPRRDIFREVNWRDSQLLRRLERQP